MTLRVPREAPLGRGAPGANRRLDRHVGRRHAAREPRLHRARRGPASSRIRCASATMPYVVRTVAYSEDGIQSKLVETDASATGLTCEAAAEEHFDAVVVGSGFGGSVTAFRLGEAGHARVPPRARQGVSARLVPRSPWGTSRNLWDPSEGLHGLFNVWEFRGLGGIVASGLGRRLAALLERPHPQGRARPSCARISSAAAGSTGPSLRGPRAALRASRGDARRGAVSRSSARRTTARSRRTRSATLRSSSGSSGSSRSSPSRSHPTAAHPAPGVPIVGDEDNLHGAPGSRAASAASATSAATTDRRTRSTSTTSRSRSCATASTSARGARRRRSLRGLAVATPSATSITARRSRVSRAGRPSPSGRSPPTGSSSAPGRSAPRSSCSRTARTSPGSASASGHGFCGNGDLLTFVMRTHETVGGKRRGRQIEPGYGPVITSTIRVKDALEGGPGRAYYVQDGGYPGDDQLDHRGRRPTGRARARRSGSRWRLLKLYLKRAGSSDVGADLSPPDRPGAVLVDDASPVRDGQGHPGRERCA